MVYESRAIQIKPPVVPKPIEALSEYQDLREEKQLIANLQKGPNDDVRRGYFKQLDN